MRLSIKIVCYKKASCNVNNDELSVLFSDQNDKTPLNKQVQSRNKKWLSQMSVWGAASLLSLTSSAIAISLTSKAIRESIYNNLAFSLTIATIAEPAAFLMSMISSIETFQRIANLFTKTHEAATQLPEAVLCQRLYPKLSRVLKIASVVLPALSPWASFYLTWFAFENLEAPPPVAWAAVSVIIIARLIMSNFTINKAWGGLLRLYTFLYEDKRPKETQEIRVFTIYKTMVTKGYALTLFSQPKSESIEAKEDEQEEKALSGLFTPRPKDNIPLTQKSFAKISACTII